jgi:hypothetical protein
MHTGTEDLLKLRELPELEPPPGVWERVLAAQQARAAARRFRHRAAAAVAAVALTGTLAYVVATLDSAPRPTLVVGVAPPFEIAAQPRPARVSYAPLVAESARLELLLAELPAPRPLMMGSTASTIVGLEDRIAFVDAQLSYAAARNLASPYREALWGERVELMNALVHVRFAQIEGY